jgi:hypothetical protein
MVRARAVGVVALLALTGCGSDVTAGDASAAAIAFVEAEPSRACQLLAPQTVKAVAKDGACADGLVAVVGASSAQVQQVEVAGESAQVRFESQVVFLARFPDGWRVTAAGCVRDDPDPSVPYECEVEP